MDGAALYDRRSRSSSSSSSRCRCHVYMSARAGARAHRRLRAMRVIYLKGGRRDDARWSR